MKKDVEVRISMTFAAELAKGGPVTVKTPRWAALPVFVASIYGGYFGAGLSVIVLAVLTE